MAHSSNLENPAMAHLLDVAVRPYGVRTGL